MNFEQNNIKKKIINEYLFIFLNLLIFIFLLPFIATVMLGDNTGIDGIGAAFAIAFILGIPVLILTFIFFIINPIRILISCKHQFKDIFPIIKRRAYIFIIIFPILFSMLIIFRIPIENFIYDLKYRTNFNSYSVSPENYKLPIDFYNELKERNLLYNKDTSSLMNRLNYNHDCVNYIKRDEILTSQKCYEKSTMVGISSEHYYDDIDNDAITDMYQKSFPVYMYNAILTLPSENETLQYAALGRFSYNSDDYGDYKAYFKDYYIECKILYVDGNVYAIIGVGESYDVSSYFRKNLMKPYYAYPYYMILTETDTITTFSNGKYNPGGSIESSFDSFEMWPNTNELEYLEYYPLRKVDKLDVTTINNIAVELQNGVLKDSIQYHFNKTRS